VSVSRGPDGKFYGQFGLNSHAVPPEGAIPANLRDAALAEFGHLGLVKPSGWVRNVSDVGDQDWTWTSTRINLAPNDFPNANPTLCSTRADTATSWMQAPTPLVEVKRNGAAKSSPSSRFQRARRATPCRHASPGALTARSTWENCSAAPTHPGHARVWRVVPRHAPKVWATGLTTVQGCGVGKDGAFYATEFETGGLNEGPTARPGWRRCAYRSARHPHASRGRKAVLPVRLRGGI
jgi:hypothetical protein